MTNGDYPRPPVPESNYPDKPFALRQPPQELFGGCLMVLFLLGLHFWWDSHPAGAKFAHGRWVLPLEMAIAALYSFWIYGRAKRTNRPKTARLMLWTGIVTVFLTFVAFGVVSYLTSKFEQTVGPGWERAR